MNRYQSLIIALLLAAAAMAQDLSDLLPRDRRGTLRAHHALRRAGGQDRGPGGDYFTGNRRQLTILAEFADQAFAGDEQATLSRWNTILNTPDLNESPFVGSIHDYFADQSYGQLNLTFDLLYIRVGKRERYRSTDEDDENSQYLVQDLVDSLLLRSIDWSLYDWNGDGYINQLLIIFAGKGSSYGGFGGGNDAIWPHQWWLTEHLKDRQKGAYCSARTVESGGKTYLVDCYCAVQELTNSDTYGSFGTLCHEYSHCFGFPDFYDYDHNRTPGKWDLMDRGCYNGGGFCPVAYSAHERWLMGWLTPTELTATTDITDMPALADQPVAYLIRNDGYADEYYILENRQPTRWDASLPGAGLVVFHIDYSPQLWLLSNNLNAGDKQHYVIIGANGKTSYTYSSGWAYPYQNCNELTNTSSPAATLWNANTDGSLLMSKPVTAISVTDGSASFRFMPTTTDNVWVKSDHPLPENGVPASNAQRGVLEGRAGEGSAKLIRHGQLLFLRHGKTYTVTGQEIK